VRAGSACLRWPSPTGTPTRDGEDPPLHAVKGGTDGSPRPADFRPGEAPSLPCRTLSRVAGSTIALPEEESQEFLKKRNPRGRPRVALT
jgi:hypothetical protein